MAIAIAPADRPVPASLSDRGAYAEPACAALSVLLHGTALLGLLLVARAVPQLAVPPPEFTVDMMFAEPTPSPPVPSPAPPAPVEPPPAEPAAPAAPSPAPPPVSQPAPPPPAAVLPPPPEPAAPAEPAPSPPPASEPAPQPPPPPVLMPPPKPSAPAQPTTEAVTPPEPEAAPPTPLPVPPVPPPAPPERARASAPPPRIAGPAPANRPVQNTAPELRPSARAPAAPAAPVTPAIGPLIPPRPVAGMADNRPPTYPEAARRRGQQGRVIVRVAVSAEGAPVNASVMQSSGYSLLDEAAVAAVRQWQFVPASQGGRPVAATAEVPVVFHLEE